MIQYEIALKIIQVLIPAIIAVIVLAGFFSVLSAYTTYIKQISFISSYYDNLVANIKKVCNSGQPSDIEVCTILIKTSRDFNCNIILKNVVFYYPLGEIAVDKNYIYLLEFEDPSIWTENINYYLYMGLYNRLQQNDFIYPPFKYSPFDNELSFEKFQEGLLETFGIDLNDINSNYYIKIAKPVQKTIKKYESLCTVKINYNIKNLYIYYEYEKKDITVFRYDPYYVNLKIKLKNIYINYFPIYPAIHPSWSCDSYTLLKNAKYYKRYIFQYTTDPLRINPSYTFSTFANLYKGVLYCAKIHITKDKNSNSVILNIEKYCIGNCK